MGYSHGIMGTAKSLSQGQDYAAGNWEGNWTSKDQMSQKPNTHLCLSKQEV